MDHLAILSSQGKFADKILSGQKPVESRWYKTRRQPWNTASSGDTIYFKESGKNVTIRAGIAKVEYHTINSDKERKELFNRYREDLAVNPEYYKKVAKSKYVILIWLENPQAIKTFKINKEGYGEGNAWISLPSIDKIRMLEEDL